MRWSLIFLLLFASCAGAAEVAGTLQWSRRVELGTPVSGVVVKVAATPGAKVGKGQLLVQLDDRRYRADLAQAKADAERLARVRDEAQREQERAQELFDRNLISSHELEVEKIAAAGAESEYQAAKAAQTKAELNIEYSALKAPFAALVVEVRAEVGQSVINDLAAVPLVVVAEAGRMVVRVLVDEAALAKLAPGAELAVQAGGQRLAGRVQRVGLEPVRDAAGNARFPLDVAINATDLRAGQSASVTLP